MEQLGQPSPSLHMTRRCVEGRFDGFDIVHTGRLRCKSFSHAWVDQGVIDGWASLALSISSRNTKHGSLIAVRAQGGRCQLYPDAVTRGSPVKSSGRP